MLLTVYRRLWWGECCTDLELRLWQCFWLIVTDLSQLMQWLIFKVCLAQFRAPATHLALISINSIFLPLPSSHLWASYQTVSCYNMKSVENALHPLIRMCDSFLYVTFRRSTWRSRKSTETLNHRQLTQHRTFNFLNAIFGLKQISTTRVACIDLVLRGLW